MSFEEEENSDRDRDTQRRERTPCRDGDRDWSNPSRAEDHGGSLAATRSQKGKERIIF